MFNLDQMPPAVHEDVLNLSGGLQIETSPGMSEMSAQAAIQEAVIDD